MPRLDGDPESVRERLQAEVDEPAVECTGEMSDVERGRLVPRHTGACRLVAQHRKVEANVLADDHSTREHLRKRVDQVGEPGRPRDPGVGDSMDATRRRGDRYSGVDARVDARLVQDDGSAHRNRSDSGRCDRLRRPVRWFPDRALPRAGPRARYDAVAGEPAFLTSSRLQAIARHRRLRPSVEWMALDDGLVAPRPGRDDVDGDPDERFDPLDEGARGQRQGGARPNSHGRRSPARHLLRRSARNVPDPSAEFGGMSRASPPSR